MRFGQLLRATVVLSAASATAMALLAVLAAERDGDVVVLVVDLVWWLAATVVGVRAGRTDRVSAAIGRLLAAARPARELPEPAPVRTLLNRLWPLLVATLVALVVGTWMPQVAGVGAGFAILAALAWRGQDGAVRAIEERDGVEFFVRRTSLVGAIELVRAPGLRRDRRSERQVAA